MEAVEEKRGKEKERRGRARVKVGVKVRGGTTMLMVDQLYSLVHELVNAGSYLP